MTMSEYPKMIFRLCFCVSFMFIIPESISTPVAMNSKKGYFFCKLSSPTYRSHTALKGLHNPTVAFREWLFMVYWPTWRPGFWINSGSLLQNYNRLPLL